MAIWLGGVAIIARPSPRADETIRALGAAGVAPTRRMGCLLSFMMFRVFTVPFRPTLGSPSALTPTAQIPNPPERPVVAHQDAQFWLLLSMLCVNVTDASACCNIADDRNVSGVIMQPQSVTRRLLSLANMVGLFFWSSLSDTSDARPPTDFFLCSRAPPVPPRHAGSVASSSSLRPHHACTGRLRTIPAYLRECFRPFRSADPRSLLNAW